MNKFITSATSLVTTHEQTRAGFLAIALEKNMIGDPYVKQALAFKAMVAHTTGPDDFFEYFPNKIVYACCCWIVRKIIATS